MLRSDSGQQIIPEAGQPLFSSPIFDVVDIQFVSEGHHNTGDIAHMLCLLAEAEEREFIDDEIFRRMQIQLTKRFPQINLLTPLKGRSS